MAKIKNLSREPLDFHVGGFDERNEPKMDCVRPGETKDLTVELDDLIVKARLNAGLIAIVDEKKKAGADKTAA